MCGGVFKGESFELRFGDPVAVVVFLVVLMVEALLVGSGVGRRSGLGTDSGL